MFIIGMIIGAMLGGTASIFLYACIIVGKESDRKLE